MRIFPKIIYDLIVAGKDFLLCPKHDPVFGDEGPIKLKARHGGQLVILPVPGDIFGYLLRQFVGPGNKPVAPGFIEPGELIGIVVNLIDILFLQR